MTQLYLTHHEIAEEHTEYINDTARSSTETGQEKTVMVEAIRVRFYIT